MFGTTAARTGIDIGTTSVKLVRGDGRERLDRITHVGIEPCTGETGSAAAALKALMKRLDLSPRRLGRVAVSVGWQDAQIQEAFTPPLDESELARALPFEARKHLDLDGIADPVLSGQLLDVVTADDTEGSARQRVLLAAVSREARDHVLSILSMAGIEPEVVDLEPLAGLNELFARLDRAELENAVVGLVDLGGHHAAMHVVGARGGLLSRNLGPGSGPDDGPAERDLYTRRLTEKILQTMTFYRGRHRTQVSRLYLIGGGAYAEGRLEAIADAAQCPVNLLDPLSAAPAGVCGAEEMADRGPELATACGLCRWGDD